MNTKAKVITFPSTAKVHELMRVYGFNEDDTIDLTRELQMGTRGRFFTEPQLEFIESWLGEDSNGAFYDTRITTAYGIEQEEGSEPGEYTWPKLADLLRRQKANEGER